MTRPLLLMTGPMHPPVAELCADRFELLRLWEYHDPDVVLDRRGGEVRAIATSGHRAVDTRLMDQVPNLEIVANFGVGYDTVDAAAAAARGVVVTNAAGVLDDEVADTAMALLLMVVRELPHAERYLRAGRWVDGTFRLSPTTMAGRTMGILGLGRIGEAIARRAQAFNIDVVYHNRREKDVPYRYYCSLTDMAGDVDTLMVVLPGGESTHHLVDEGVLTALGPDGVIVNIGRGSVVDEAALAQALSEGTIRGAGLDVFENEPHPLPALLDLDNVVLLPHVGSASEPTREAMARRCVENVLSWFDNGTALTPVPECVELAQAGSRKAQRDGQGAGTNS